MPLKKERKFEKKQDVAREIRRILNVTMNKVIPVAIEALGTVANNFENIRGK